MNDNLEVKLKEIILDSIKNVICIDEEYAEPYDVEAKSEEVSKSKEVYDAFFTNLKCKTLMVKYKLGEDSWKEHLNQQDLVVLDWKLAEPENSELTLQVIDEVVKKDIRFLCIFTSSDGEDLNRIKNIVKTHFIGYTAAQVEEIVNRASSISISEDDVRLMPGLMASKDDVKDLREKLRDKGLELAQKQREIFDFRDPGLWNVLYAYYVCKTPAFSTIRINTVDTDLCIVDGTYIFFVSKGKTENGLEPMRVINEIVKELLEADRIFDIVWMYYYNSIRNSMGKKNKLPFKVTSNALKYHALSAIEHDGEDEYFSTLYELIMDETTEDIKRQDGLKPDRSIIDKIKAQAESIKDDEVIQELKKINAFLNTNYATSTNEHSVVMGDVFFECENATNQKRYYICVSALCDCAHPKTIGGMNVYNFIMGAAKSGMINDDDEEENGIDDIGSLDNPEDRWLSYIMDSENVVLIQWDKTVFSGYVIKDTGKVKEGENLKVKFGNEDHEFAYVCNIKTKYAQRLANRAFSWGNRVGTTYAKKRKRNEK